jgi:hypothetical protein
MKQFVLMFIFSACLPTLANCDEVQTPERIATRFFETLLQGKGAEAIDFFMGSNRFLKSNGQQVEQMKSQLSDAVRLYGRPFAVEPVSVEDLTPSLQRRVYLVKHPNHPLVWEMYFYRAKNEWIPDQLVFVDRYQVIGRMK